MGIEELRWWHWTIASLVIGCALAYVYNGLPQTPDVPGAGQIQFENDILHPPVDAVGGAKVPWVDQLRVYPPMVVRDAQGNAFQTQVVIYRVQVPVPNNPNQNQFAPRWFTGHYPYVPSEQDYRTSASRRALVGSKTLPPGIQELYIPTPDDTAVTIAKKVYHNDSADAAELIKIANQDFRIHITVAKSIAAGRMAAGEPVLIPWSPDKQKTVRDWLDAMKSEAPWVQYQYAWWREPRNARILWIGGSFLILGVITPAVFSLLASVGLGKQPKRREMDLSRFGKKQSVAKKLAASTTEMTPEELDQLRAYEEQVKAGLATAEPREAAPVKPVASAPARVMTDKPLEPSAASAQEDDVKEFGGEFYPVVRSVHKAGEEDSATAGTDTDNTAPKPPVSDK